MPELPEVERARRALEAIAKGRRISKVITMVDSIVFSSVTHAVFASSIEGQVVKEVKRKGKNFYMTLSTPQTPIFHFGMSGSSQTKGYAADTYRVPRAKNNIAIWPPKYVKACLTFQDVETGEEVGEWAFCDSRRLGRIKLVQGEIPELVEPLCLLGRDPYLDMPDLNYLVEKLSKRHAPIKAVLLDQQGPICGIGNWMIDEICYQARIHPSYPASALTLSQLIALHTQIRDVTATAVAVNAEASLFPKDWLFKSRWGKGKKNGSKFILPSGEETTISFITVGGRTSAVVEAVQILPEEIIISLDAAKKKRDVSKKERESGQKESKGKGKDKRRVSNDQESNEEEKGKELDFEDDENVKEEEAEVSGTSPHFNKIKKLKLENSSSSSASSSPKFKLPESLISPRLEVGID